jgi:hypothetical protein
MVAVFPDQPMRSTHGTHVRLVCGARPAPQREKFCWSESSAARFRPRKQNTEKDRSSALALEDPLSLLLDLERAASPGVIPPIDLWSFGINDLSAVCNT